MKKNLYQAVKQHEQQAYKTVDVDRLARQARQKYDHMEEDRLRMLDLDIAEALERMEKKQ